MGVSRQLDADQPNCRMARDPTTIVKSRPA
jgi:hypothetical protein